MLRLLVKKKELSGGHWVTITKEGPLHGRHLYIDNNGVILAGKVPAEYHGKSLHEIHAPHQDQPHLHEAYSKMSDKDLHEAHKTATEAMKHWDESYLVHQNAKKAKEVIEHYQLGNHAKKGAPHIHMQTAHHIGMTSTEEQLKQKIADAKGSAEHEPTAKGKAYYEKQAEVLEHHLKVKQGFNMKREIPDTAPHLSKQPIHNTMSEMTPSELKAAIKEAKQNLKDGVGAVAYNKKKIAVASYYLNGGQKPDDSMFGPKGKKGESDAGITENVSNDDYDLPDNGQEEAPKAVEAPHMNNVGLHDLFSKMDPEALSDAINHAKDKYQAYEDAGAHKIADLWQKKIEIASYYKNGGQKPDSEAPASEAPKAEATSGSEAPHPELTGTHKTLSGMSAEGLKKYIDNVDKVLANPEGESKSYIERAKKRKEIAQHYLAQKQKSKTKAEEAPKADSKYSGPHLELTTAHDIYSKYQEGQLKDVIEGMKDTDAEKYAKKIEVAEYYLKQKQDADKQADAPVKDSKYSGPHADTHEGFHQSYHNASEAYLIHSKDKATHAVNNPTGVEPFDNAKKAELDIINHYLALKDAEKKDHAAMDDFHNPTHQIKTSGEHIGKNVKDYGVDLSDPNHMHPWQTPIDHSNLGMTSSDMKSQAKDLMHMIDHGDDITGTTSGSVAAKKKVQTNLGNALEHHEDFQALAKVIKDHVGFQHVYDPKTSNEYSQGAVSALVSKWAYTSAGDDPLAIAVQLVAKEAFGLDNTHDKFDDYATKQAHAKYLSNPQLKRGLHAFLHEQYSQTQAYFKAHGITHVPIFRGMRFDTSDPVAHIQKNSASKAKMSLQPLSSFSASSSMAFSFANENKGTGGKGPHKVMVGAMIPVERIIGCPQTGYGCQSEHEYVVMGASKSHDQMVAYRWYGHDTGGFSHSDIFKHMHEQGEEGVTSSELAPKKKKKTSSLKVKADGPKYHIQDQHGDFAPASDAKDFPNDHGLDLFMSKSPSGYKVYDKHTGKAIANTGKTTPGEAKKYVDEFIEWKGADAVKEHLAQHKKVPEELTKSARKSDGIINADADPFNADWTKRTWDNLPEPGTDEFNKFVSDNGGMQSVMKMPVYQYYMDKKAHDAMAKSAGIRPSSRYAYKTNVKDPIYVPVNRLKTIYQTEKATNPDKVAENVRRMKDGEALAPIVIGYDHDVHDGHHRLEAAKEIGHTHVPCVVGGRNDRRTAAAEKRYRSIWKSMKQVGGLFLKKSTTRENRTERAQLLIKKDKK